MSIRVQFVKAAVAYRNGLVSLKEVTKAAVKAGATRKELVEWLVSAKFSESWARQVVSAAMQKAGKHARTPGAGRKTPKEAKELLKYAVRKYGDKAASILLAAYRLATK